jgi:hypothetical protein
MPNKNAMREIQIKNPGKPKKIGEIQTKNSEIQA